ncbi:mandelate racemase/muconate lactonizing enzyme family protein [Mesorhizobium sp. M1066]|uniref:mandelate racemase/muconate lactonizing enzyme family protein n=1 Tax=unclassified Mesorhizobium TaxID=325217 RepID=UPI003337C383
MKIAAVEFIPVSIPYKHAEISSRVARGGVTDVVVKMLSDDGRSGWGECCSGADTLSILAAAQAMTPFLIGKDPRDSQLIRRNVYGPGLWDYRVQTGNFAYAGLDMAMQDLAAQAAGLPLWRLLGGRGSAETPDYFCYLARGDEGDLTRQCEEAVAQGYHYFYLKVGVDPIEDVAMLATVRAAIGPSRKLRIDANEAWSVPLAAKLIARWDQEFDLDFVEGPIRARPVAAMAKLRQRLTTSLCANEGLGSETEVLEMITADAADVLCFSSYWVGGLQSFLTLSRTAGLAGIKVCKHTHGELGIAAVAHHHALLALGNSVGGHQQTASVMADDILAVDLPIRTSPHWGEIEAPGLGIEIDAGKLAFYHQRFVGDGQFLPWAATSEAPHGHAAA